MADTIVSLPRSRRSRASDSRGLILRHNKVSSRRQEERSKNAGRYPRHLSIENRDGVSCADRRKFAGFDDSSAREPHPDNRGGGNRASSGPGWDAKIVDEQARNPGRDLPASTQTSDNNAPWRSLRSDHKFGRRDVFSCHYYVFVKTCAQLSEL